ncbi:hypothetical protein OBBRIDRAFT_418934 [Obba rivulosa]|uniref:Uncharacterized protein n=1 Tax=Obba rivulosa TaxID=1052685 RepID=A0A8E2AYL7_9APHY|nr:hypothetical protein OBBRIDRAFT_418934 [Obba rivulosa]
MGPRQDCTSACEKSCTFLRSHLCRERRGRDALIWIGRLLEFYRYICSISGPGTCGFDVSVWYCKSHDVQSCLASHGHRCPRRHTCGERSADAAFFDGKTPAALHVGAAVDSGEAGTVVRVIAAFTDCCAETVVCSASADTQGDKAAAGSGWPTAGGGFQGGPVAIEGDRGEDLHPTRCRLRLAAVSQRGALDSS